MYGQQSLMPRISTVTWGFGGGQLIEPQLRALGVRPGRREPRRRLVG